ncbi:DivIVA domain-containing protein [Bifidobacterium favimelis]|uniref:DivIVA domain-containing protein n=1 Tax=Bifidobacterium favimelis TaxID=3122979 RepID=A0ABU8ZNT4_9BIFI
MRSRTKFTGKKGQEVDVLMAAESESRRNEATIARSGKHKWGYDIRQVDEFLEKAHSLYESDEPKLTPGDIANASFDMRKNGYIIPQVDSALARLQRAVCDKWTSWEINRLGRARWYAGAVASQKALSDHAARGKKNLFDPGLPGKPSYDRKQVDRLVGQIIDRTAIELKLGQDGAGPEDKLVDITSDLVANVIFTQRKGARGYDERQVDYYLSKAVELLQQLESCARLGLADMAGAGTEQYRPVPAPSFTPNSAGADSQGMSAQAGQTGVLPPLGNPSASETEVIKPLFATPAQREWEGTMIDDRPHQPVSQETQAYAPTPLPPDSGSSRTVQPQDDFANLHREEAAIFEAPAPSPAYPADSAQAGTPSLGALAQSVGANRGRNQQDVSTPAGDGYGQGQDSQEASRGPSQPPTQVSSTLPPAPSPAVPMPPSQPAPPAGREDVRKSDGQAADGSEQAAKEDPDKYLDSLLKVDMPKMDLDIPDLSFPGFDQSDGTDDKHDA